MKIGKEMKEKAELLLAQMTLDEKIGMIHGDGLFKTKAVERLGIPSLYMSDGPMGVRQEWQNGKWIPVGATEDYTSYLPSNSAIASTWNRELARECGRVLGAEARGRGKDVILAPGINIKRSPLNGRNFEYMSEDPYLTTEQCVPLIEGIQENDVAACVKHFALNNQETQRLKVDTLVDERALREIYLPAFEAAVNRAHSYSLMGAYNQFRGEFCSESTYLLDEILRKEWGYEGVVISDWGAVHHTKEAAQCSLDLEMSVTDDFDDYFMAQPLKKAVEAGEIEETQIDEKVRHILWMMLQLNLFEVDTEKRIAVETRRKAGFYNAPSHRESTLKAAREAIVLLKNENQILPFEKKKLKKLLVIGQNANRIHSNGGGSAEIKALYEISPLLGMMTQLGGNSQVKFVKGYYEDQKAEDATNWQEDSLADGGGRERETVAVSEELAKKRKELLEEAVRYAKEYEYVIFVGGLNHEYDVEGQDRLDMKLPYGQDEVIEAVLEANPNAVIVMVAGSPVEMGRWADKAKAIVWSWYAGMESGTALAEILLGEVNPSAKLPESFPYTHTDCSAHCVGEFGREDVVQYREGIYVGYRYYEKEQVPVRFCFGHGLSYTEFSYSDMTIQKTESEVECSIVVSCNVKNTGKRAGKEIVQLYIKDKNGKVDKPVKELKGYEKVELEPGESRRIRMQLSKKDFAYYEENKKVFQVLPGVYEIVLAASSQDERLSGEVRLGDC